ncbi:MAG: flavin reductase [Clostridium sp.]|nr:flavin reductase [Clostridium sp.]MCM1398289.1 flavin reductase [Clostridium sp.]MCM1459047.1 flavin reductase [Bacteroides sp.]
MDKKVFRNMSYGVYIVTTMDGMRPTGCVANSCMQITSEPSVVAVSINHDNYTNKCIKESKSLAVNILAEETDMTLIGRFGFQSAKDIDKFEGVPFEWAYGNPVFATSCGWFAGDVVGSYETSTHTVFFVEVKDAKALSGNPMTYAYYHKVKNGVSPKNAPTYQAEEQEKPETQSTSSQRWVCSICGYIYEGDIPFEELPEDWVCPVCKQPKSKFKKG